MPEVARVAEVRLIKAVCAVRLLHGKVEWFGLGGTFKGHLVQPPGNEEGRLQLDPVAQSPVQAEPWDEACPASLGNGFQCFATLMVKDVFLVSSLNVGSRS